MAGRAYGGRLDEGPFGHVEYHEYLEPGDNPRMNKYTGAAAGRIKAHLDGGADSVPLGGIAGKPRGKETGKAVGLRPVGAYA